MPRDALPDQWKDKPHNDWPWPLSYISRNWTSYKWGKPKMMWGNQKHFKAGEGAPKPIGEPGSWQISRYPFGPKWASKLPTYFAFTTKGGTHVRFGARWDDIDRYVTFPSAAIKRDIK